MAKFPGADPRGHCNSRRDCRIVVVYMPDHDILIVGAGPTGLMLALECQRFGLSFALVEKRLQPSEHSKALGIWSGTLEALAPLGLTEMFLSQGLRIEAARFADRGHELARFDAAEGVDSLYPHPIILPQNETESLLNTALEARGGRMERGLELIDLRQEPQGITATLKGTDGTLSTRTCRYLVGCDGSRSAARNLAGVEFPGRTEPATFLLYDGPIEGHPGFPEMMACWSGEGAILAFPIKPGLYRLICQRERGEDLSPPTREELQEQVDRNGPPGWKLGEPLWVSAFRISERIADRFTQGRVVLCGDAAHIHSPAGGQGMNTGMQDAANLGWKLSELIRLKATPPDHWLDSYQAERHPVAESVVRGASDKLRFGLAQGLLARVIKDLAVSTVFQSAAFRKHLALELSELGVQYQESPLLAADAWAYSNGGFPPGTRVRNATVTNLAGETHPLWDDFLHPGFTLLFFSGEEAAEAATLWEALCGTLAQEAPGAPIRTLAIWQASGSADRVASASIRFDPSGVVHRRFGVHGAGWYWIRPDLYVGARSCPVCLETLRSVLHLYFKVPEDESTTNP